MINVTAIQARDILRLDHEKYHTPLLELNVRVWCPYCELERMEAAHDSTSFFAFLNSSLLIFHNKHHFDQNVVEPECAFCRLNFAEKAALIKVQTVVSEKIKEEVEPKEITITIREETFSESKRNRELLLALLRELNS